VTAYASGPQIDTTAPAVTSIAASGSGITNGNGDLDAGHTVTLTVGFSKNMTVNTTNGTPFLRLNDGGTASYVSGSSGTALTFSYTVAAGQNTADLAVTGLVPNGGTIQDGAGNNALSRAS
jgi:large repetitive protein